MAQFRCTAQKTDLDIFYCVIEFRFLINFLSIVRHNFGRDVTSYKTFCSPCRLTILFYNRIAWNTKFDSMSKELLWLVVMSQHARRDAVSRIKHIRLSTEYIEVYVKMCTNAFLKEKFLRRPKIFNVMFVLLITKKLKIENVKRGFFKNYWTNHCSLFLNCFCLHDYWFILYHLFRSALLNTSWSYFYMVCINPNMG